MPFGQFDIIAYLGIHDVDFSRKLNEANVKAERMANTVNRVMNAALIAGAAAFGTVAFKAAEFETKMGEIHSLLGTEAGPTMEEYNETLIEMSTAIPLDVVDDFAVGLYNIVSATVPVNQQLSVLKVTSEAAIAGVAGLNETFKLGSSIVKGYGLEFSDMDYVMDVVFQTVKEGQTTMAELASSMGGAIPIAATMGVEFEEVAGAMATLSGVTGTTAEASTQLEGIMTALLKPTGDLEDAYKKLGVKSGPELIKVSGGLQDAMNLLKDYTERYNVKIGDLIGRKEALVAYFSLTGNLADTFRKKTKKMYQAVGAASEAFDIQMNLLSKQATLFKNIIESSFIKTGNDYIGVLKEVLKWMNKHPQTIQTLVTIMTKLAITVGAVVAAYKAYKLGAKALQAINAMMATSFGPIGLAITGLVVAYTAINEIMKAHHRAVLAEIEGVSDQVAEVGRLESQYNRLIKVSKPTEYQQKKLKEITDKLTDAYEEAGISVEDYRKNFGNLVKEYRKFKIEQLKKKQEELNEQQKKLADSSNSWWLRLGVLTSLLGVSNTTVTRRIKKLDNLNEQQKKVSDEIKELETNQKALNDIGIQTEEQLRDQVEALEALLATTKPNTVEHRELTEKINDLKEKLGEAVPKVVEMKDKQELLKDAGIETKDSYIEQKKKLEELIPYVQSDSMATADLTGKLYDLYAKMEDTEAIRQLIDHTEDFEAKQRLLEAAGIDTTSAMESQKEMLEILKPAVEGDSLATADLNAKLYDFYSQVNDIEGLRNLIDSLDTMKEKQDLLKHAGIETTSALNDQKLKMEALKPAVEGDSIATADLNGKLYDLYLRMEDTEAIEQLIDGLGTLEDKQNLLEHAGIQTTQSINDQRLAFEALVPAAREDDVAMRDLLNKIKPLYEQVGDLEGWNNYITSLGLTNTEVERLLNPTGDLTDKQELLRKATESLKDPNADLIQQYRDLIESGSLTADETEVVKQAMERLENSTGDLNDTFRKTGDFLVWISGEMGILDQNGQSMAGTFVGLLTGAIDPVSAGLNFLGTAFSMLTQKKEPVVRTLEEVKTSLGFLGTSIDETKELINSLSSTFQSGLVDSLEAQIDSYLEQLRYAEGESREILETLVEQAEQELEDLLAAFDLTDRYDELFDELEYLLSFAERIETEFGDVDLGGFDNMLRETLYEVEILMMELDPTSEAFQELFEEWAAALEQLTESGDLGALTDELIHIGNVMADLDPGTELWEELREQLIQVFARMVDLGQNINYEAIQELYGITAEEISAALEEIRASMEETSEPIENLSTDLFDLADMGHEMGPFSDDLQGNMEKIKTSFEEVSISIFDLDEAFNQNLGTLQSLTQQAQDFQDYYGNIDMSELIEQLNQSAIASIDMLNSLDPNSQAFADMAEQIFNAAMQIQSMGGDMTQLIYYLQSTGVSMSDLIEAFNSVDEPVDNFNKNVEAASDGVNDLVHNLHEVVEPIDRFTELEHPFRNINDDAQSASNNVKTLIHDLYDLISDLESQQEAIDVQLEIDLAPLQEQADEVYNHLQNLLAQREELQIQIDLQLETATNEFNTFQSNIQNVLDDLQSGDVDFNNIRNALEEITGESQALEIQWNDMLSAIFQDYQQFGDDVAAAQQAIEQMMYFGEVDEGAMEQINAAIFQMQDYLATLNPDSQAYLDAQQALDDLISQYQELGGQLDEEAAIRFNTEQAQQALQDAEDAYNETVDEIQNQAIPIDAEIEQAQQQLDALNQQMNDLIADAEQQRLEIQMQIDQAQQQLDALLEQILLAQNDIQQPIPLNLDPLPALNNLEQVRDRYNEINQDMQNTFHPNLDDSIAISKLDGIKGEYDSLSTLVESGINLSINDSTAISSIESTKSEFNSLSTLVESSITPVIDSNSATSKLTEIKDKYETTKMQVESAIDLSIDDSSVFRSIDRIVQSLNDIPRNLDINLNYQENNAPQYQYRTGGYIPQASTGAYFGSLPKFADGGMLAVLHPPEVVIRPEVTKKYSPIQWNAFNRTGDPDILKASSPVVNITIENPGLNTRVRVGDDTYTIDSNIYGRIKYIEREMEISDNPYK